MPYPEHVSEKVCRALHKDHWDYVKADEWWCPLCSKMREE